MNKYLRAGAAGLVLTAMLGTAGCAQKDNGEFKAKLDTEENVSLSVCGFFGNFEALDQVINDFNQIYPDVEFSYEQVGGDNYGEYLAANPKVDILMTSEESLDKSENGLEDLCADLSKEDISLDDIEEDMLTRGTRDGKLLSIPMGQNMYGLVVNKSLLEKEGLSVPDNYEEFIKTLTVLKDKGYTPIQGPVDKIYAELTYNMAFDMILDDEDLYNDLTEGKESAAEKLAPVYDRLKELMDFTDHTVNETYPKDNYDEAILKFFEGDVPFWVCNTEKVSGMKKRESKSEAFQAEPFDYTYIFAPLGDDGVYAYREAWVGFAANKNSDNYDYVIEFLRFLATKDEINQMGEIKGVPSVAVDKNDVAVYQNVLNPKKIELNCVNEGKITSAMIEDWYTCTNKYVAGDFATEKEAMEYFVGLCSGQITE